MTASVSSGDLVSDASPPLAWLRDLLWPASAGFRTSIERADGDTGRRDPRVVRASFRLEPNPPGPVVEASGRRIPSSVQRRDVPVRTDPEACGRGLDQIGRRLRTFA